MMKTSKDIKKNGNRQTTFDVYVGHVPKTMQQATLFEVFSKHGEVVDVLIRHAAGAYGYAIVKFKQKRDADKVLREVAKVYVGNHEMEVKNGKRSNQNVENCNGATAMVKTVTFAEPSTSFQQFGNVLLDPALSPNKSKFGAYAASDNSCTPVMAEIMCTNVENAVIFHGCPISRFEELQVLSTKLNSICPNLLRLPKKPAINKIYGALYNEDHRWYRCCVLQCAAPTNSSMCIVEYIDYGNAAEVSYTDMVDLPEPIKKLNPFAIRCIFSNLIPSPKSQNNISYLHHLVNSRMSLCALSPWGVPEYHVLKCSCNGIDVVAELVRNGYAMYPCQVSPKASPSPNNLDKASGSKPQENHKTKKVNGCPVNRKVADTCNGIDKHSYEIRNGGVQDQVKNCRSSSSIESHHAQDFIPKKIIKRGSDTCILNHRIIDENKTVNDHLKMDSVISTLKLVNNIRDLVPLDANDDLINKAIDLLRNEMNVTISDESKQLVENAYTKYNAALKDIKDCTNEEMLLDLKKKRNELQIELCNELNHFLENFDSMLFEKRKKIQVTITDLESNSTAWLNVYLPRIPDTIEGLLVAFNEEKERKRNSIEIARRNTNEKREKFLNTLHNIGKEFTLNMGDGKPDDSYFVSTEGKKGSWDLKFHEDLTELGIALEEERTTSTVIKDQTFVPVIKCIQEKLEIPKEKIDAECELYKKYKLLYDDLTYTYDFSPLFDELHTLYRSIQEFNSCSDNDENAEKHSDQLFALHSALLREDVLLVDLAKASAEHFPELVQEHPKLKLKEYQKYFGLLKSSWDIRFFPFFEKCSRIEPSYTSKFADEPVVIKEFDVSCEYENDFMKKVKTWNEIRSNSLVKVKGLFRDKTRNVMYAVLPSVWETLYDKPLAVPVDYKAALNILQQVLAGLCDIHSRGVVHGAVHPMALLHNNGKVLLDFNFDKQYLQDKLCLKGINFQVPSSEDTFKSADMYGFGCLVLWVLFPNLSFHSTDQGVPNISPFQSIIQEMLFRKDFSSLSALLNVNSNIRPSSRVLLSNGFLKDLRIMSKAAS